MISGIANGLLELIKESAGADVRKAYVQNTARSGKNAVLRAARMRGGGGDRSRRQRHK